MGFNFVVNIVNREILIDTSQLKESTNSFCSSSSPQSRKQNLPPLTPDLNKSLPRNFGSKLSIKKSAKYLSLSVDSNEDVDSSTLPDTNNKKRLPNNLEPILDGNCLLNNGRHLETPITIDNLTESGRNSRQSLVPITNRDSNSARYLSVRIRLFRINKIILHDVGFSQLEF